MRKRFCSRPGHGYNSHMSLVVGARDLKNRLGSYLRAVREGAHIVVTERGQPVAELHALARPASELEARLQRLAAEGLVTLPTLDHLPPRVPLQIAGASMSDAIIEDRGDRV